MHSDNCPKARLVLENGEEFMGFSFGAMRPAAGEVVFNTGMVGYPKSLTDPSYRGQILALTYPLVGNYGVPGRESSDGILSNFESEGIHASGLVVSDYSFEYSHWNAKKSLAQWLVEEEIPAISGVDTRRLTKLLREKGTMLGKIVFENGDMEFFDPNAVDVVKNVSIPKPVTYNESVDGAARKRVLVIDCGVKYNLLRNLIRRNVTVIRAPYDYDFSGEDFDGIIISNGPGDPKACVDTIRNVTKAMEGKIPIFGICLGNQILALAAGGDTYKLKYGHRSQNQPCILNGTKRCFITSQNHGFAVRMGSLGEEWEEYFINANDGTNEGIRHKTKPFFSVQFHPEAFPGPNDTNFLFDTFIKMIK